MTTLRWVRPPVQGRSRRTLVRILRATERLVAEKPFDQVSVDEIVRAAGSSKGAFYARFRDKESLLRALAQDYYAGARLTAEAVLCPDRWADVPAQDVVHGLVEFLVEHTRPRHGLFRSFVHRAIRAPEYQVLEETSNRFVAEGVAELLRDSLPGLEPDELRRRVTVAVAVVFGTLLKTFLHPGTLDGEDRDLADDLTRCFLAAVGLPQGAARVEDPESRASAGAPEART